MYNIEFQFHLNICKYNVQWNLSKSIICMTYKNIMYQQLTIVCWQTVIRKITSCHWMWFLQWNCPLGMQILNLETEAICFELLVWTTKVKHQKRVIQYIKHDNDDQSLNVFLLIPSLFAHPHTRVFYLYS